MNLLDLYAKISIDKSEYEKGLEEASKDSTNFASKLGGGLKTAGKVVTGVMAATTTAVVAVGGAMIANAKKTAEYGDEIDKNSQKLGISAKSYQEWEAVLQHSGTSMGSMGASFKKLATAAQDASDDQVKAFERIGMSMEDVANMSTEELWSRTIAGLQGMEEGTERTALATQLLGKGAQELGPLLNTSAEDTQKMIDTVNELGGVMSDKAVKDSAAFQDAMQDLGTAFDGVKKSAGSELLPVLTDLINRVTEGLPVMAEAVGTVIEKVGSGVSTAAQYVTENWDTISSVTSTVFGVVVEVISTTWDVICEIFEALKGAVETVSESFNGGGIQISSIVEFVKGAIQTAGQIIIAIINAVASVIAWLVREAQTDGTVINTVFNAISGYIQTAMAVASGIIQAFIQLLNGDWKGAFNTAKQTAMTVFESIKTTISTKIEAVKTKVSTVLESVKNAFSEKLEAARSKVASIIERIKGLFNISLKLDMKLPHISVSGGSAPWGIGGKGSLPSFSVAWYAKAMDKGLMFTSPTVLDTGSGLKGFGDAGAEMVIGRDSMMQMIADAQNSGGVVGVLQEIKEELRDYKDNVGDIIASVLNNYGIKYNDRELARMIREVTA